MACGEFSLIARYFNRDGYSRPDVDTGIGDDCALMTPPEKRQLAISVDTLVAGTHFLADIDPADLGYKSLAVNLSDLAAMGADPAWLTLALTLPEVDEPWLQRFSDSLFEALGYYDMQLIGGDTTRGPLSLTLGIHGWVPQGKALKRSGAKPGDGIYVTGSLGDSAAGLAILLNQLAVNDKQVQHYLAQRHLRPTPRVLQGQALRGLASSAIDLSDGLASDLGHILAASGVGARIELETLPLSDALRSCTSSEQAIRWALTGGEDYELCFTVPEVNRGALEVALGHLGAPWHCIGLVVPASEGMTFWRNGEQAVMDWKGYDHFTKE
ncbi:thiamine-monophosphate kinase [Salmonella enterica subsp. enterica serovar Choleraesuis]|nr:thiamine-monophosphate kinase [Salmonella enterica subsp. enterica serovar Choleraesuis]